MWGRIRTAKPPRACDWLPGNSYLHIFYLFSFRLSSEFGHGPSLIGSPLPSRFFPTELSYHVPWSRKSATFRFASENITVKIP